MVDVALTDVAVGVVRRGLGGSRDGVEWCAKVTGAARLHGCGRRAGRLSMRRDVVACCPSGFVEPCLPSPAERVPSGPNWIHEIKHDGFRLMARRDPTGVPSVFDRNI